MAKCPFRINAIPPYNAVTDGGCAADGETDDRAALAASITAALAAGKRLYLPGGTYHCHLSSYIGLSLLSNLYMYGDGLTTILQFADDGNESNTGLLVSGKTGITVRDMLLTGTLTGTNTGVKNIVVGTSTACNFLGLTHDKCAYGMKFDSTGGGTSYGMTVTDMTSLTDTGQPLYMSRLEDSTFNNLDLYALETARTPAAFHNVYITSYCDSLTFNTVALSGCMSQALHLWDMTGSGNITFNDVSFTDVRLALVVGGATVGNSNPILIDGMTVSGSYRDGVGDGYVVWFQNAHDVTIKNFACDMPVGEGDYLLYTTGTNTGNLFQDGYITNSAYTANTPKSANPTTPSGVSYDTVTVNGTVVNYP